MTKWKEIELENAVVFAPKVKLQKGKPCAFIAMEDLNSTDNFVHSTKVIDFEGQSGAKFSQGHILFARITPCLQNRKIAQAELGIHKHGFGSTEFLVFDEKPDVSDRNFLLYLLKTDYVVNHAINSMVGASGRQRADWQYFKTIKIPLPPLPMQRQIAAVLGRYDALLENYKGQVVALEELAQELYREWFMRGRCPEAEAGSTGELPVGWKVQRLGDVIELKYGKALIAEDRIPGNFPVVGSSGIVDFHDEPLVDRPGIVVGRKGNVGSVFWLDRPFFPIDTAFYVESKLSPYYLFYNLQGQNFISGDAAVPGLNREQALGNKIVVPDTDSLNEFDRIIGTLFKKVSNIKTQMEALRATRDALLPRLLSGQLLPSSIPAID